MLKVGGYFCARTPHKYEYISIIARLVHNKNLYRFIKIAQPDRKMEDTFNTCYKMNTLSTVRRLFYNYKDYSYLQSADPNYFFGKKWLYNLILFAHRFLPRVFYSNMFIFMKKIN